MQLRGRQPHRHAQAPHGRGPLAGRTGRGRACPRRPAGSGPPPGASSRQQTPGRRSRRGMTAGRNGPSAAPRAGDSGWLRRGAGGLGLWRGRNARKREEEEGEGRRTRVARHFRLPLLGDGGGHGRRGAGAGRAALVAAGRDGGERVPGLPPAPAAAARRGRAALRPAGTSPLPEGPSRGWCAGLGLPSGCWEGDGAGGALSRGSVSCRALSGDRCSSTSAAGKGSRRPRPPLTPRLSVRGCYKKYLVKEVGAQGAAPGPGCISSCSSALHGNHTLILAARGWCCAVSSSWLGVGAARQGCNRDSK